MNQPTDDSQTSKQQPETMYLKAEMQTTGLKEFFGSVQPGSDVILMVGDEEISRFKMPAR